MSPRLPRRPRWLSRPVAVVAAAVVGLGGVGGATGALLGGLGATGPGTHQDAGRHHDPHGRFADDDGPGDNAGSPGPGPLR